MFEGESNDGGGIRGSIRRLLESSTEFLASKLDLIGVEFQEEKRRVFDLLILTAAVLLFGLLALVLLSFSLVAWAWDTGYRWPALFGLTGVYMLIAILLFVRLRRTAAEATRIFQTTTDELRKDVDWVKRHFKS